MKRRLILATVSLVMGVTSFSSPAQNQDSTKTTLPQDQCQATYSTSDQALTIPCVTANIQGQAINYQVVLKQIDNSASNFSLFAASPSESVANDSKCAATYSIDTGRLDVPCAGLLSIPHETSKPLTLHTATPTQPNAFSLTDSSINTRRALTYPSKNKVILIDGLDLDRTKGCLLYQISENKTIQQLTGFTDQDIQNFVAFFSKNYSIALLHH
jgi:hypothetical protein